MRILSDVKFVLNGTIFVKRGVRRKLISKVVIPSDKSFLKLLLNKEDKTILQ
jgi:predicted DNA-binding protein (UPF0278 family)